MRCVTALLALLMTLGVAAEAMAQAKQAKPGTYEALSDPDRRIVSAIYEAQLGSRRDLAGHPLLSKDAIAAMRRGRTWEDVHEGLAARGSVASRTLAHAIRSYNRHMGPAAGSPIIISTGTGEQVFVARRAAPRAVPPDPARANIIPAPITVRPKITVVELPMATAGDPEPRGVQVESYGGLVAPGATAGLVAASRAQSR